MTYDDAFKIFEEWRKYTEIADKLTQIFSALPESFLPYPAKVLEKALNIVAERYFNKGDKEKAKIIQNSMTGFLFCHENDEDAILSMCEKLEQMREHSELKNIYLEKLKSTHMTWFEINMKKNKLNLEDIT